MKSGFPHSRSQVFANIDVVGLPFQVQVENQQKEQHMAKSYY